jgi:hypothetical protein
MSVPLRLTDNNMCKADPQYDELGEVINPYCYEPELELCTSSVSWTNPGGSTLNLCVTTDGRVLDGRVGASRTRMSLVPYTQEDGTVSAWVVMAYEESKGLGETEDDEEEPVDIGKNVWYHTFDMFAPDIVAQGLQLNQPAIDPETGTFFDMLTDEWGNPFYDTEIARRFNIISQSPGKVGESGTVLVTIFKQGIINQGGPADILIRRFVLPSGFDPTIDNPYAYDNLVCEEWVYKDGSNPNYVNGLCLDAAMNVSATNIDACLPAAEDCAGAFPWDGGEEFPKVTVWSQDEENLDDQTWENPYDVAKGHRGFIDGDFIMMIYAWSPNWKANSSGQDKYNLYVRRSFDGGQTWTTTPASLGGSGTSFIENFLDGTSIEYTLGAGEFEPARNVSQLTGTRITVLDPRYTPTIGSLLEPTLYTEGYDFPQYNDDIRDPSKFFIVYETGDNTVLPEFAAVPLDLFYSRGYVYGDMYDVVEFYNENTGETEERWDWLEKQQDDLSGEASVTTNPGGTFFYAVWNQWQELEPEHITESDIIFRRVMYLDDEDGIPLASILFCSHDAASYAAEDVISFVGTARDTDHIGEGIVAYRWASSLDGELSTNKDFTIQATSLSLGLHTISFSALDAEGNWSPEATVTVLVGEVIYLNRLPIVYLP